jgi:hypothetical protein
MVKAMSRAQRAQAHVLLKTGLSQKGYLTATSIMDLENVLRAIEGGRRRRGAHRPAALRPRSALLFTRLRDAVGGAPGLASGRPSHLAALRHRRQRRRQLDLWLNLAQVMDGLKKACACSAEEDAGRALVLALDDSARWRR